jgi:DNA gyrase/topoisomerase IV subunit A
MKLTPKTGRIIATLVVQESDDVMIVTTSGMVTRVSARGISRQGRAAQGVMVMTFKEGKNDAVSSVAIITEDKATPRTGEVNMNGNGDGKHKGNGHTPLSLDSMSEISANGKHSPNGNGHKPLDGASDDDSSAK